MALRWDHGPWGQLEVTALGQRCPNYLILRKKIALAGARVGATSLPFKRLWNALVTFFTFFFSFSGQLGFSRISQLPSP